MKNKNLVSVIVPVFNSERYLSRCIDSILHQSYSYLELILVDDGSTDDSPKICDAFMEKDSRIKVIHQSNRGVSSARNSGINSSCGDYLMFVDSDDTISINAIELLLNDASAYHADIVSAVKTTIDTDGYIHCAYEDGLVNVYDGLVPLKMSLEYDRQTNSACAKLFSRSFIGNLRFVDGRTINEDGYFIFQCYARCPVLVQHNVSVYQYYVHLNSSSRECFSEKYFDMIYFADEKMKYIRDNHPDLMKSAINMEVSTHLFFLEVLCRTNDKKYITARDNSIRIVKKNYRLYVTQNRHEHKMAKIVRLGLYPIYKMLWRVKYG